MPPSAKEIQKFPRHIMVRSELSHNIVNIYFYGSTVKTITAKF